nr:reverse transcriptase domain-containing protein [Tanacetum cinerariifolium]
MEGKARASRMAWTQSMDASDAAHSGVIALRTQVSAQRTEIIDLRAADRRFQTTKMAPKRTTRSSLSTTTTTTTPVADAQHKALIDQGVADALAIRTGIDVCQDVPEESNKINRKSEDTTRNNQNQHQQNKRQNTSRAYTVGSGEKKPYRGSKPLYSKCNNHHDGLCAPKCHKCNRVGHLTRDCRSPTNTNIANNQRGFKA